MVVEPIYARGFFNMDIRGEVYEFVTFYYYDNENYYISLEKEKLKDEIYKLKANMQYYLNKEKIFINSTRVSSKVLNVKIRLLSTNYPIIDFFIKFKGRLRKGLNSYVDVYEKEVSEYPYDFVWILPGKIVKVKIHGKVKVKNNMMNVSINAGEEVGGKEEIVFNV
ncbi:hypothetical protein [Acidianus manzaensis]|uniref:Uncharacterized protein n=1 Tax=Acidianus manzaensis TaxID=282676 RepID=A0A1W6JWI0_9CREN|nr:hypothetical protein [Acidianus manzaensis]ARM74618.1 hypothetical protein B6F84_00315 [Acidianus manzaensis]